MNRPTLPPLRLAVAQFDDTKVLEALGDKPNRLTSHRAACSPRLHSDLSFYSLASSSSPQYKFCNGGVGSPNGDLLSTGQVDNTGHYSLSSSRNSSLSRSFSCFDQPSDSRQYHGEGLQNSQADGLEAQPVSRYPREISSWKQPIPELSISCRATQSKSQWNQDIPHCKSECENNSSPKSHLYYQSQVEVNKNSHVAYSQPDSNLSHQSTGLVEHPQGRSRPERTIAQGVPDFFSKSNVHFPGTRYFCPVEGCSKSFTRNFNLTQHISAIHNDERRFQCT